ncbi:MAG: hypothetical protein IJ151_06485 [Bacteroidales bacterium]|nr:hypothetical protein [Bacteroidales bacterium]
MKQLLFAIHLVVLLVLCPINTWGDNKELSQEQLALRNDITEFLREEGFMPEIDPDGNIRFKSEGYTCIVSVSSVDENPMYISLYIPFKYPDGYSEDDVALATKALNKYKGVKVVCFDGSFRISGELYLRDADLFKESFYKLMSQINNVRKAFMDEIKKTSGSSSSISEIPFLVTKVEVANVENDGTVIQDYGSTISYSKSKYLQPRITIKPFKTGTYTLYIRLYKDNILQRSTSSSPENYTFSDSVTISSISSQEKTLTGWGSKTSGTWSRGTYRYEVWINDYCIGSKTFMVI